MFAEALVSCGAADEPEGGLGGFEGLGEMLDALFVVACFEGGLAFVGVGCHGFVFSRYC